MIKAFIDYEFRNFKKSLKIIYYVVVIFFQQKIRVCEYLVIFLKFKFSLPYFHLSRLLA